MGNGYSILIWDGWGAGLVMLNPRFHEEGMDCYGNPCNWFSCEGDVPSEAVVREKHGLNSVNHLRVIA